MSCCLTVILAFVALCVMFLEVIAGLVVFDIVFLLLFLGSKKQAENAKKLKPSKMICSNCKSTNVMLSTREAGKSMSGSHYGHWVSGSTRIHYERIAECKSCGFTWNYITKEDIDNERKRLDNLTRGYGIIFAILMIITIWIFI